MTRDAATGSASVPRNLRARRHAARAAAWKEVQALASLPSPTTSLEPTMASIEVTGSFAWEVLE